MLKIDFNKTYLSGKENEYITDALQRGSISGDGYYTARVSEFLEEKFDLNRVLMTTSATHALEIKQRLLFRFTMPGSAVKWIRLGKSQQKMISMLLKMLLMQLIVFIRESLQVAWEILAVTAFTAAKILSVVKGEP
ncbi:MAG: lipopolysaccharide biosynthesis protein [Halanaerobium sp.]|nr:MAG: lipopolysaccharide biosynthesis protein [Halanaerobium sp.]